MGIHYLGFYGVHIGSTWIVARRPPPVLQASRSMHIVMVTVLNVGNLCFGFTPAMTARRLRQRVVRRASYVSCGCGCLVREDMSIILQPNLAWPPVLGDAVETFRGLLARPIYAVDAVLRAPAQEFKIGP